MSIITTTLGLLEVEILVPTWLSVIILILSLYFGGFFVYKEVVDKLPDTAELNFQVDSADFISRGWGPVFPSSPLELNINLTINNKGGEKAKLSSINFFEIKLNSEYFTPNIDEIKYSEVPPDSQKRKITFPIEIPGRDWTSIVCKIPIYTMERPDKKELVHIIKKLTNFNLSMSYEYEDMDGKTFHDRIKISGDYSNFIQKAIANWKSRDQHELVYVMHGIDD